MVKLVDMPDLGSGAARRVGSSPITRTKSFSNLRGFFNFNNLVNKMFKVYFLLVYTTGEMLLFLLH